MNNSAPTQDTYRVLVIDDTRGIHEDIRKVLASPKKNVVGSFEIEVGSETTSSPLRESHFEIDSAFQGEEGLACVRKAQQEGRPYALAFLDMRMPPGIDGRETIRRLRQMDSDLQVVLCTAYSDYTWEDIAATTGPTARVLILRKPFEPIEIRQLAHALTEKWRLEREEQSRMGALKNLVAEQTRELTETQAVLHLIVEETIERQNRRRR